MHTFGIENTSMLSWTARIWFISTFILMMIFSLGVSLWLASGAPVVALSSMHYWFAATSVFLIMSGYALAFVLGYWFVTYSMSRWVRVAASVVLFVLAFLFFISSMGGHYSGKEISLLVLGAISVVISDRVAEIVGKRAAVRPKPSRGRPQS